MRFPAQRSGFLALCLLTASGVVRAAPPKAPVIPEDVQASLKARVEAGETAGIIVGWIDASGEAYAAAGVRQIGAPGPVDPDTIFEIGSITKAFTGIVLADMARRGQVKLDDPVSKFLPDKVKMPQDASRPITLFDLATHRSGLPRLPANLSPADPDDPYVDYTSTKLYTFLGEFKLAREVGAVYEYSNLGLGLLGHALARAEGVDYDTLVRQHIGNPLGLKSTFLQVDPQAKGRLATGYEESGGKLAPAKPWTFKPTSALAGAGGLRSTARDMLRLLAASAGIAESRLSPSLADARASRASGNDAGGEVALAWQLRKIGDRRIVWHNGATGGFHSYCAFDPEAKTGVVVLSNSTADIDDIGLHLLAPSLGLRRAEKPVVLPEEQLARLDGWYDLGDAMIRVTHEGNQLFAQFSGQGRYPVFAKSATTFIYRVVPATLEFEVRDDGTVPQVTLHQGTRHLPATRIPADRAPKERVEIPVDAKLLAEYAGRYQLSESVVIDVRVSGTRLTIQLTGQPTFEAYAESPTSFFLKRVDAQLAFQRNEAGKVDAVILHQGGADRKATRLAP
jgi:CubicO group peptidase (beta-lactamase class C family)